MLGLQTLPLAKRVQSLWVTLPISVFFQRMARHAQLPIAGVRDVKYADKCISWSTYGTMNGSDLGASLEVLLGGC